ncbi:metal-sulfur cluster assembly factor [Sphaerotilus mobilis]|uniref:Metal-sulfur cluster biosynthetic enzyme n=1 Tax=Sphaerotilus mobilis TaxID=47994 RepID=A0A4Q7LK86_9BURK|nr:iron-sulfur cluster assembly protein [Sphaerotilus mobilis]RZS54824.1 metal-sulfur cluster biosynthetic enzyme [Sphaerotilus mobilis]
MSRCPDISYLPMSCPSGLAEPPRPGLSSDADLRLAGPTGALLRALDALRGVRDPLLGAGIVELGLVESLQIEDGDVRLCLVAIGPDCPLCDFAADRALRALQAALPDTDIYVRHDPWLEWTPERASPGLRDRLDAVRHG